MTPPTLPTSSPVAASPLPVSASAPDQCRCPNCAAPIAFSPTDAQLVCPYCGHAMPIPQSAEEVQELDFEAIVEQAAEAGSIAGLESEVRCEGCGAVLLLPVKTATDRCPYCQFSITHAPTVAARMVPPGAVLPFRVEKRQAGELFVQWIKSLWFAPSELVRSAHAGEIKGLYYPFWTYDALTINYYTGLRGMHYFDTVYVTVQRPDGSTAQEARQVMRTMWTPTSGRCDERFDDVLVAASDTLPRTHVSELDPWDLAALTPFQSAYLQGFQTERYQVPPAQGFKIAEQKMAAVIQHRCRQSIGGDVQQVTSVKTQYVGITTKHLLLPIWHAAYRHREKVYHFVVNGRTGEVQGQRPISGWKVAGLVTSILIAVATVVFLANRQ